MATYQSTLSQVFPHCIVVPSETAIWLMGELTTPFREDGFGFSSFAATADTDSSAEIKLWLSEVSWKFVARKLNLESKVEST